MMPWQWSNDGVSQWVLIGRCKLQWLPAAAPRAPRRAAPRAAPPECPRSAQSRCRSITKHGLTWIKTWINGINICVPLYPSGCCYAGFMIWVPQSLCTPLSPFVTQHTSEIAHQEAAWELTGAAKIAPNCLTPLSLPKSTKSEDFWLPKVFCHLQNRGTGQRLRVLLMVFCCAHDVPMMCPPLRTARWEQAASLAP